MVKRLGAPPGGPDFLLGQQTGVAGKGLELRELGVIQAVLGAVLDAVISGFDFQAPARGGGFAGKRIARRRVQARGFFVENLQQFAALFGRKLMAGAGGAAAELVDLGAGRDERLLARGPARGRRNSEINQGRQNQQSEQMDGQAPPGQLRPPGKEPNATQRAQERGLRFGGLAERDRQRWRHLEAVRRNGHEVTLSKMFFNERLWLRMACTVTPLSSSKPVQRA
jgi:hypothetical protein